MTKPLETRPETALNATSGELFSHADTKATPKQKYSTDEGVWRG